ncbi:MAG TPA: O-antigen ligase family protein [Blastocatellia bacterium]
MSAKVRSWHLDQAKRLLLIGWFATTAIASYFIRFPIDKSVLTFDRTMICGLGFWLLIDEVRGRSHHFPSLLEPSDSSFETGRTGKIPAAALSFGDGLITATRFEIAFGLLAVVALISVATRSINVGPSVRVAFDAIVLPLVVFRLARRWLNIGEHGSIIATAAILLSLFLMLFGGYELISGVNLFPYKGSELVREGEFRVNGPFVADSSYALIALLLAVFLLAAPRILGVRRGSGTKLWLRLGAFAAIVATLLPLFRSVVLALGICWVVIEVFSGRSAQKRDPKLQPRRGLGTKGVLPTPAVAMTLRPGTKAGAKTVAIGGVLLALFIALALAAGGVATNRLTSSQNLLGRLATWESALKIWGTHPLLGVGLGNYADAFAGQHGGQESSFDTGLNTHAANAPHSNVLWIASELGAVGLGLYLAAFYFLFASGFRMLRRSRSPKARAAALCFLAVLIAYWIPGLDLTPGQYWDVNLFYFFILGFLSSAVA